MKWIGASEDEQKQMLDAVGVDTIADLVANIPRRLDGLLDLPAAMSEPQMMRYLSELAASNSPAGPGRCFLGAGAYEHAAPAAVDAIISRGEYFTAYTPYQPEASQGTLTWTFEFQSMVAEIMALDAGNASMYDGASALAEALLLALRHTKRNRVVLSSLIHPQWLEVVRTYLSGVGAEIAIVPASAGRTDASALADLVDSSTAAVAVQTPNFLGVLDQAEQIAETAHKAGALCIGACNPVSLGVVRPPGEWGADIAVGDAQPLGIPLSFGGPYAGLFAVRQPLVRQMPGRLAGMAWDAEGRRGFTLTLQTREQHIRRERATSNICTNQALVALAATVYLSLVGKSGFREISRQNLALAHGGAARICTVAGVSLAYPEAPFFNEFVIDLGQPASEVTGRMRELGYQAGLDLGACGFDPNHLLVAITETKTEADIANYASAMAEAVR